MNRARSAGLVAVAALLVSIAAAQPPGRRLSTIDAVRRFPGFYHLQNVLLRGEFVENSGRVVLRSDESEMRVALSDAQSRSGAVEVRGQAIDLGRLEPDDPRATPFANGRDRDRWPKPGEELVLNVTSVAEAPPATTASVRALALEPWKFAGQMVTVTGNFRGRNLFGDLPDAPGKSRDDFVLRGSEGAIWVTGMKPRGRGFDLDVDRRLDSNRWLQVTGTVNIDRGLVSIAAMRLAIAEAQESTAPAEDAAPPAPPRPLDVVFSSPTDMETEVGVRTPVRIQFSRGLQEPTLRDHIRVTYVGASALGPDAAMPPMFKTSYDAGSRAIAITFAAPLEPFRTVKVELLDGIKAFDGGPLAPWSVTFSTGG